MILRLPLSLIARIQAGRESLGLGFKVQGLGLGFGVFGLGVKDFFRALGLQGLGLLYDLYRV